MSFRFPHKMFEKQTALFADFQDFEQKIQALAQQINLDLNQYEIDHLSLRVNSAQRACAWLALLLNYGTVLSDNQVNGRVIYLIALAEPLYLTGRPIDIVELPLPKDKAYPKETWEHIEVVVPFLTGESEAEWFTRIKNLFLRNQSAELKVKTSEPKAEGEKLANLSVAISFADKRCNHVCIKVHPYSIKQIVSAV